MARAFDIDEYEPVEGAYTDVEAPINEAYLDLRDAIEVYSQLFGRRTTSSTVAGIRDGETVLRKMMLKSKTRRRSHYHHSSTTLEGTVETRDTGTATDIEYAFTVNPRSHTEYAFITELLDPQHGGQEPGDVLPDAEIVLAEKDVGTMIRQGTLEDADGRAATYIEQYARVEDPHDWLEPGDMAAAEAYADWMDHPFNPEKHRIAPTSPSARADSPNTDADEDTESWAFRIILTDREREKDTVTYTVKLQADDSDTPFTGHADDAGTITFTVPHTKETLQATWERHHDSA